MNTLAMPFPERVAADFFDAGKTESDQGNYSKAVICFALAAGLYESAPGYVWNAKIARSRVEHCQTILAK